MYDVEAEGSFRDVTLRESSARTTPGIFRSKKPLHILQLWNIDLEDSLHDSRDDRRDLILEVTSAIEENFRRGYSVENGQPN